HWKGKPHLLTSRCSGPWLALLPRPLSVSVRDLAEQRHAEHGPYYVSVGAAALGRPLKMVWRWQTPSIVWPITAFFPGRLPKRRRGAKGDARTTSPERSPDTR